MQALQCPQAELVPAMADVPCWRVSVLYLAGALGKGKTRVWAGWRRMGQDFTRLLRTVHNLKLIFGLFHLKFWTAIDQSNDNCGKWSWE